MNPDHAPWRERVLAYEELDPEERRETDAHLASCSPCHALLAALRAREAGARVEGQLTVEPQPLSAEDARTEQASVERLVERLAPDSELPAHARRPTVLPARVPWWRSRSAWLVPVAAAAVVLAVVIMNGVRPTRPPLPRLEALEVLRASNLRGVADSVFHTGDAFAVHVRLTAPGIPIVVVLDEAGIPSLLYPAAGERVSEHAAGALVLPETGTGVVWTFSGAPGRETFLSAAVPASAADFDALRARLAGIEAEPHGRAGRLRAARALLEGFAGAVEEVTVQHVR